MSSPPPIRLRSPAEQAVDAASVVNALSETFAVTVGARRAVRRSQLDTFDRRLAASHLVLEHQTAGDGGVLVLRVRDDVEVTADASGLRTPLKSEDLPEGRLRDALAPVMGIRALTPGPEARRGIRRAELRNDDDKLVVVLELDEPATRAGTATDIVVRPLRGYDPEARRVTRTLRSLGLAQVEPDRADKPRTPDAEVTASAPAGELLAVVLGDFLATMEANLPGLLDDVDTEFLHDFRVAVRRTRSTLKLGRAALPAVWRETWEPTFKWLGDLTTPVRDLDVYELALPTMSTWLVGASADDLAPFRAHLRRRRAKERRALVRGLTSARYRRLVDEWDEALRSLGEISNDDDARSLSAGKLAQDSIGKAGRRVMRGGSSVHADSPAEDLHTLRKRCKELRYALEVFAPVIDTRARKRLVTDLKSLQDVLGRFQDAEVQREALRGFASEMMAEGTSAESVLAMGELIGHLDTAQDDARREFDDAFGRFARPVNRQRLAGLAGRQ